MKPVGCTGCAPSGILVGDSISWATVSSEIKIVNFAFILSLLHQHVLLLVSLSLSYQPDALQTMSLNELSTSRFSFFNDNEDL
jgi:hypothetical protein